MKRQTIGKILFYVLVALYPILPSYTRFLGYAVYTWLIFIVFALVFLLNIDKAKFVPARFLIGFLAVFTLYAVPFLVNQQPERIIFEVIDVMIPLITICFILKTHSGVTETAISIVLVISFLLCLSGLVEAFFEFNVFSLIENMTYENSRFGSIATYRWEMIRIEQSFNTALTYALYQTMCFGLTFYCFLIRKHKKLQYFVLMVLQAINIVLTLTRGIAFLFFVGVLLLLYVNRSTLGIKKLFFIFTASVFLLIMLLSTSPDFLELVEKLFSAAFSILLTGSGGRFDDNSVSLRESYQRAAFDALQSPRNFIFGVGEYGLREMVSIDNEFLLEITGYGILGFLAFLILIGSPIVFSMLKIRKAKRKKDKQSLVFYRCMLVVCVIYAASLYTVAQMADSRMYYLIWGLTMCHEYQSHHRGEMRYAYIDDCIELQ